MTFRKLIQMYSQNVNSGHSDNDVTNRQRRYLHVLLNLAGNSYIGDVPYSTVTTDDRANIIRGMGKDIENVRWFLNDGQESDFDAMVHRAIEILRNM